MKKKISAFILITTTCIFAFSQKVPENLKTEFSGEALEQTVIDKNGKEITLQTVIKEHKGKVVVVELWAGWCKDCLADMPASRELKSKNPEVDFIYLSLDRSPESWKVGIEKYELGTGSNYWFSSGWKNPFNEYIDLNWIPRYMVLDQDGKIAKYYAVSADDTEIRTVIDKLLSK